MTDDRVLGTDPHTAAGLGVGTGTGAGGLDLAMVDSTVVFDGQLVGDPSGHAARWFERVQNGFCRPATIAQIVSEYVGVHVENESKFVERANELRVFDIGPDGVPGIGIDGALVLLEDGGVPAYIEVGAGRDTLVDYHDEGRRVMLAVDSGKIWHDEHSEDRQVDRAVAVVVTGVDVERGVVLLSVPDASKDNSIEYPISELEAAWADSGFAALVCDLPPEERSVQRAVEEDDLSTVESAMKWAISHPWVVLPLLLGGRCRPPGGRGRRA